MKIGLDTDNVILDTDEEILKEMLIEDRKKRNRGIINKDADYIFLGMFDWTKEEVDEFLNNNIPCILYKTKYEKREVKDLDSVTSWEKLYIKLLEISDKS